MCRRIAAMFAIALTLPTMTAHAGKRQRVTAARPVPPIFSTVNRGMTFASPPGASNCPLIDWTGTDHGTVILLERPRRCWGAGYSSSERGYAPADLARIEVYYGIHDEDAGAQAPDCKHRFGTVRLFGRDRPLCGGDTRRGRIEREVTAYYTSGGENELSLRLVTTHARLARDLAVFRRMAASVRTCSSLSPGMTGAMVRWGKGAPCRGTFY